MANEAKKKADKLSATARWSSGDQVREQDEAGDHRLRVARLVEALGESGAGRLAVLQAIAEKQGLTEDETENLMSGKAGSSISAHTARGELCAALVSATRSHL